MVSTTYARSLIASRGSMLGRVNNRMQQLNDTNNIIDMAPSLAEADAILARFGYVEPVAIAA